MGCIIKGSYLLWQPERTRGGMALLSFFLTLDFKKKISLYEFLTGFPDECEPFQQSGKHQAVIGDQLWYTIEHGHPEEFKNMRFMTI